MRRLARYQMYGTEVLQDNGSLSHKGLMAMYMSISCYIVPL